MFWLPAQPLTGTSAGTGRVLRLVAKDHAGASLASGEVRGRLGTCAIWSAARRLAPVACNGLHQTYGVAASMTVAQDALKDPPPPETSHKSSISRIDREFDGAECGHV